MNRNQRQSRHVLGAVCAATLGLLSLNAAHAQQLTTLVNFDGTDGTDPLAGVTLSDGVLYGTTSADSGGGTIFSVPVTGGTPTTLAITSQRFDSYSTLILSGGTLYGTDEYGGDYGIGSVFSVPVTATGTGTFDTPPPPTTLVSFDNGGQPVGDLTLSGDTLYGTTSSGNTYGTVYSLNLSTGMVTTLASFNGANGQGPSAGLTLGGSTLYGTTAGNSFGSVFSVPVNGGAVTDLAGASNNVLNAQAGLTLVGNTLYGTTYGNNNGNSAQGTLFSLNLSTGTVTTLVNFTGGNGGNPESNLTLNGDTLYGTTVVGGADNDGTVFSFNLDTGTLTTLVSFDGTNGANPQGDLTISGNTLYGTTEEGGTDNYGTVFSLQLQAVAAPEPSSYSMLLFGALGLAAMGCFRNAGRIKISLASPRSHVVLGNAPVGPPSLPTHPRGKRDRQ